MLNNSISIVFPVIELIDRLVIAEIKLEKCNANQDEVNWYKDQFQRYDFSSIETEYQQLKEIHKHIWSLESDIRCGVEQQLGLEEVGRRAIEIRNWNNKRVQLKNRIAEKLTCTIKEIKRDHLSE